MTAEPVKSETMERRWRGRRVGTADDAGALCGCSADTFQKYVKRQGAPGPVRFRDPDTGRLLYDLDAVAVWHANRPGQGARTDLDRIDG